MWKQSIILATMACAASGAMAAAAGGSPVLNVEKTCRAAQPLLGDDTQAKAAKADAGKPYKDCMTSENDARKRASGLWSKAKASDRSSCEGLSKIVYPSYVELAACLEMYQPVPASPTQTIKTGQTGPGASRGK
jgi:hypothetical protein